MYSALIEYGNGNAKLAHYLIEIVGYDDLNDQQREWVSELLVRLVTNPTLSRAIGIFNIYHQC